MLRSSSHFISLQDVPDEISLCISLSGCPIHCKGCHSSFTWDPNFGEVLTQDVLQKIINSSRHISCVCFYGGEWSLDDLIGFMKIVKQNKLKVCLYTGLTLNQLKLNQIYDKIIDLLDYLKVGPWQGKTLRDFDTNQRMYRVENKNLIDITEAFWVILK